MAITKKALEIRQQKQALRQTIDDLNGQMRQAASRVPKSVRGGSYQTAVEWKELAEKAINGISGSGPKSASVAQLQKLIQKKLATLKKLAGE